MVLKSWGHKLQYILWIFHKIGVLYVYTVRKTENQKILYFNNNKYIKMSVVLSSRAKNYYQRIFLKNLRTFFPLCIGGVSIPWGGGRVSTIHQLTVGQKLFIK